MAKKRWQANEDCTHVIVRNIPEEINERMAELARRSGVSKQAWMKSRLEMAVRKEEKP